MSKNVQFKANKSKETINAIDPKLESGLQSTDSVKSILKNKNSNQVREDSGFDQYKTPLKMEVGGDEENRKLDIETCSVKSEYDMQSDIFDFKQLMDHPQFGIKIYKNATYKGIINGENKREGFGVLIHNT